MTLCPTCTVTPPWAEYHYACELRDFGGRTQMVRMATKNTARPDRWREIIDTRRNRVVSMSLKSVAVLRTLCLPHERVALARRRDRKGTPASAVRTWAP